MKLCRAFCVLLFALLLATMASAVLAQVPTSTINGIVTDPHQAVVERRARCGH